MRVMGNEPRSSGKTASVLNHCTIAPISRLLLLMYCSFCFCIFLFSLPNFNFFSPLISLNCFKIGLVNILIIVIFFIFPFLPPCLLPSSLPLALPSLLPVLMLGLQDPMQAIHVLSHRAVSQSLSPLLIFFPSLRICVTFCAQLMKIPIFFVN